MFLDGFYADPMLYIGAAFALAGAFAAAHFLAGFFPGLPGVFTLTAHEEHQDQYRQRAVWGLTLATAIFIVWECVRIVASWFGYPAPNMGAFGIFISALLLVLGIAGIIVGIKKGLGRAHH